MATPSTYPLSSDDLIAEFSELSYPLSSGDLLGIATGVPIAYPLSSDDVLGISGVVSISRNITTTYTSYVAADPSNKFGFGTPESTTTGAGYYSYIADGAFALPNGESFDFGWVHRAGDGTYPKTLYLNFKGEPTVGLNTGQSPAHLVAKPVRVYIQDAGWYSVSSASTHNYFRPTSPSDNYAYAIRTLSSYHLTGLNLPAALKSTKTRNIIVELES